MIKTVNQEVYCCDNCGRILGPVDFKTFSKYRYKITSNKITKTKYKMFCNDFCEIEYSKPKYSVQITYDNYDILHNPLVKEKYPILYDEIYKHDKICHSSWYTLSTEAYKEFHEYKEDETINYYF